MATLRLLSPALRRPTNFCTGIRSVSPPKFTTAPLRQFHLTTRPSPIRTQLIKQRRAFTTEPAIPYRRPDRATQIRKLVQAGALFGGTLLAAHLLFNTTSDPTSPPLPEYERAFLNETFLYTGVGVGIIGLGAKLAHNSGWSLRLMSANPWLVLGVSLVGSIGTMMACRATPPENYVLKHGLWTAFNLTQSLVLAPMFFYHPALLARAGLYTAGIMGSIAFVGATAKQDKYLYLGGPLLAGVAVVALSGLAPMVLPLGSRALVGAEAISLYGGLAVFAGFTLYDTQKILYHARMARQGMMKRDTVNESISLELDFINIFVRLVTILGRGQERRR